MTGGPCIDSITRHLDASPAACFSGNRSRERRFLEGGCFSMKFTVGSLAALIRSYSARFVSRSEIFERRRATDRLPRVILLCNWPLPRRELKFTASRGELALCTFYQPSRNFSWNPCLWAAWKSIRLSQIRTIIWPFSMNRGLRGFKKVEARYGIVVKIISQTSENVE